MKVKRKAVDRNPEILAPACFVALKIDKYPKIRKSMEHSPRIAPCLCHTHHGMSYG